jgi:hypothetical protein
MAATRRESRVDEESEAHHGTNRGETKANSTEVFLPCMEASGALPTARRGGHVGHGGAHSLSRLEWRSREVRLGTLSRQGIARKSRATVWESTGGMDFGHGDGVRRDGRGRIRPGLFELEKKAGTREMVAAVSLYGGRAWRISRIIPDYPEVHGGFMVSLRLWPRPGHGCGVQELLQRTGSPDRGLRERSGLRG